MAQESFRQVTFDIPTVAKSATATGYATMKMPRGVIKYAMVDAAGASTDLDLRLGNATMANDRAAHIWKIEAVNGAGYDDGIYAWFNLTDNKLFWRVTNNDVANATGIITVTLLFDTAFTFTDHGTLTVT